MIHFIVNDVVNYLHHVLGQTHFERLRNTFQLVRDGYCYTRHGDGANFDIRFVDFDHADHNIFRAVNQFEGAYGMKDDVRIPDVLLFVNGIPLCIFELKNPTKLDADIAQAYEQIHPRYMCDIPYLLRYCPLSCISDATDNNTRLGKTYTMMFIARQLALSRNALGSPTVIMIVDRDDLQTQAGKLFLCSKSFIGQQY